MNPEIVDSGSTNTGKCKCSRAEGFSRFARPDLDRFARPDLALARFERATTEDRKETSEVRKAKRSEMWNV